MRKQPRPWLEDRLDELAHLGKNKSGLAAALHKSESTVTGLIDGGRQIRVEELKVVADYLMWDLTKLYEMETGEEFPLVELDTIKVVGAVEAGAYREAVVWHEDEWRSSPVRKDRNYPHLHQFGLEVRGNSMNEIYPPGTTLVCAKLHDLERNPKVGEKVIAYRRNTEGVEATVKELRQAEDGTYWLWPRSTDPNHQSPLPLSYDDPFGDAEDIVIHAVVLFALVPQTGDF